MIPKPITIDFETLPIEARPVYPPKPVGVSIKMQRDRVPTYFAFGHPTKNNCSEEQARRAYKAAIKEGHDTGDGVLFHNGKFDLDVGETHWGVKLPPWHLVHDTMYLLFLFDPYSPDVKLKPAAERHLGMAPEEKDALRDWLIANKIMKANQKETGKFIYLTPGDLCGRYANGDSMRTHKLFQFLWPKIQELSMITAYDRERRLMPVLLENEREGVKFDTALASKHSKMYEAAAASCDTWLRKTLHQPNLNLDSDADLAEALIESGTADEGKFLWTAPSKTHPGGQMSTAKDSLIGAVTNKRVLSVLQYRAKLDTACGTFMNPWLKQALATGGTVHPSWNQVRSAGSSGGGVGARTGRLSASRFMNVPKEFKEKKGKFAYPVVPRDLPELPFMRRYLLPDKSEVWVKRDYKQQELRVLGHYEDGVLLQSYKDDPELDVHDLATGLMREQFGLDVSRDQMKTIGFALIYGMGLAELAERLGVSVADARQIKEAYLSIFPGLKELDDDLKQLGRTGGKLRTWGGRLYGSEAPKFVKSRGRVCTFEYKLLNYLIQGSSADCTKEAVIRYGGAKREGRLLVTVHDEIDLSVPKVAMRREAQLLREIMASIEFDVPMLSDASVGPNWAELVTLKEKPL